MKRYTSFDEVIEPLEPYKNHHLYKHAVRELRTKFYVRGATYARSIALNIRDAFEEEKIAKEG